jgi:transglutaminase-like putative cysteine protease
MPLMRLFVVRKVLDPAGVGSHDPAGAAQAIQRWVRDNIRFVNEPGEQLLTPARVLIWRFGDCDDRSGLVAAMLESIRMRWRLVLTTRAGIPFHIHPQTFLPKSGWVDLETSHPDAQYGEGPIKLMKRMQGLSL